MRHIVQPGDTLYSIAKKYNLSTNELLSINGLKPTSVLQIGQSLFVSQANATPEGQSAVEYTVQSGDTLYAIGKKFNIPPQEILRINGLSTNSGIYVGQKLKVSSNSSNSVVHEDNPNMKQIRYYTVQAGDSLFKIAKQFGTTPEEILGLNNMSPQATIYIGQQLKVAEMPANTPPVSSPSLAVEDYTVQAGDSLYLIAQNFNTTPADLLSMNGLPVNASIYVGQILKVPTRSKSNGNTSIPDSKSPADTKYRVHTVSPGEWLAKIAKDYSVQPEDIVRLNSIRGNNIYIGQKLMIPFSSTPNPPSHLQGNTKVIAQNREILSLEKVDGKLAIGKGLLGRIAADTNIHAEDLEKVQLRLMQLGFLAEDHDENPYRLQQQTGGDIWGKNIPQTISAIRKLQDRYRLNWWVANTQRCEMLGTNRFTAGVIDNGDITFKFLREFTEYELSFPHPITGQTITINFNNFVRSGYNVYYHGVGFHGNSSAESVPLSTFLELGLDENLAMAMRYISQHEGNFDAINTYDKAIFSYGFIQFAGGGRGFGPLMARMKVREPELFKMYFQDLGIDVTYTTRNGDIHKGELQLVDIHASQGQFEVSGEDAEKALRADPQLYGAFMRAAYHPAFIKCQIEQAIRAYVVPALGIKLNLNIGGQQYTDVPITEIINSPMGLGFAIDMTVNKWITKTGQLFEGAIQMVANESGLYSFDQLKSIDEKLVIQSIIDNNGDDQRIVTRGGNMLNSELAATKRQNGGLGLLT
ncbi:LysM peptidoglycan-binding domain-containing protein [Limibacter armeniacum]|uniref:muramidase family protein n=1 Tax=Limibacter armeniacum TaxID=466084 RepID=UPI002FE692B2